ncbi:MAG: YgaP-like transmembrane domain [Halobacteriaceae archaeon]
MDRTVGDADRIVRLAVGAVLVVVALAAFGGTFGALSSGTTALAVAGVVVGAVLLVTGYTRFCLVYSLLGIDTLGGDDGERETGGRRPT